MSKMCQGCPPGGGWRVRAAAQNLPGVPPYAPIHVGREESVESPSTREPNWRQGGAPHLATKIFPGVSAYIPLLKNFMGPWPPLGGLDAIQSPPPLLRQWVCVEGLCLSEPSVQNVARDYLLFSEFSKCSGPVAASAVTPVASLPPPVPVGMCGQVRTYQTL